MQKKLNVFGKIVNLHWQIFHNFEQIFIVLIGQILKNNIAIWSHCFSLSQVRLSYKILLMFFYFFRPCLSFSVSFRTLGHSTARDVSARSNFCFFQLCTIFLISNSLQIVAHKRTNRNFNYSKLPALANHHFQSAQSNKNHYN